MDKRINSLGELDLPNLTPADLRYRFGTGQAISTGSGRDKKYTYRTGVMTPLGDIEISVWLEAAEYLVEEYGLQEELEHLKPYARFPLDRGTPAAQREARADILDACLSQLYRDPQWVKFLEYNQKYHPELLAGVPMVTVITECCQRPGLVPTAQIKQHMGDPAVPCPHCGRTTAFVVMEEHEKGVDTHGERPQIFSSPGLS